MIRRTSEQWLALIEQHKTSGFTQTAFAKLQGMDPSYFSQRKRQLLAWQQDDNDGFIDCSCSMRLREVFVWRLLRSFKPH